ncbi:MAG: four helix bundle protein [Verrucomicrobia bacterium]|nr:four helix bundle protein [Verrucomicrobiota bacterium]
MAIIQNFRELKVYQQSRAQAQRVFELSRTFPREERYSLTDQIRRSSRAVKSMIAEAWGHRRYPAAFISKLTGALGEATETQSWLDDALDCGYITAAQHREHDAAWQSIGGMLNNTIEKADDFCRSAS